MQLAASQRAHPPPVPPRPSRQVVAEALKKSPRPPCPTRQAPPPPNQRPWRLEEQPREPAGRTVVYSSAEEERRRAREPPNGREEPPRQSIKLEVVPADNNNDGEPRKPHCVSFREEQQCATVVVIEEPRCQDERDNIQRQDWLEAGVRYSSTKITLPAEEVAVNGFARRERSPPPAGDAEEEEQRQEGELENQLEFADLDFSR